VTDKPEITADDLSAVYGHGDVGESLVPARPFCRRSRVVRGLKVRRRQERSLNAVLIEHGIDTFVSLILW